MVIKNKTPLLLFVLFFLLAIIPFVTFFVRKHIVVGFIVFLPSLICLFIFFVTNQKPINWDRNKSYYIEQCATTIAISGMTHSEVYTQKGTMRVAVQKKISVITNEVRDVIENNENFLLSELQKKMLIDNDHNIEQKNRFVFLNELVKLVLAYKNQIPRLNSADNFITIDNFLELYSNHKGDFVGVYILYNKDKNMYYVGQATRCLFRINQHFTGHGNGDVYADFKYGNTFAVKMIKMSESGYEDLDLLEKHMIERYQAYNYGYNKTKGNG